MKYLLTLIFVLSFYVSDCQIFDFGKKRDYYKIVTSRNVEDFDNYLIKHPKSLYNAEVIKRRDCLKRQIEWNWVRYTTDTIEMKNYIKKYQYQTIDCDIVGYGFDIENDVSTFQNKLNSIRIDNHWNRINTNNNSLSTVEYENFNKKYPDSKYYKIANDTINNRKKRLEKIKKQENDWILTKNSNDYSKYLEFNKKYPKSIHIDSCLLFLKNIEQKDWDKACKTNTVKAYENFENKFPNGYYFNEAEKKIVDIELQKIKKNNPTANWKPMDITSYDRNSLRSTIIMENETGYTIKVLFSGTETKRIYIKPDEEVTLKLLNGRYTVSATIEKSDIKPYWGYENYQGYEYSSVWVIQTTFGGVSLPNFKIP